MSDKFKVIDHATFEQMQQSSSKTSAATTTTFTKIRNAKYKRMSAAANGCGGFNLLQFVVRKKSGGNSTKRKRKIPKRVLDDRFKPSFKKKGKQRENGRKQKASRLKKSILRYRLMRRNQEKLQAEVTSQLQTLTLSPDEANAAPKDTKSSGIHSSRFRDYCDNCTTPALKEHAEHLLRELNRFQRRAYAQNQIKARAHRRFVVGFREVYNFLCISKVKLVIIATDCERCEGEMGLDQTISDIKKLCHDQQVPIAFSFQRRQLAYFLYKKASVSCIGILDYDGVRDTFQQLIVALKEARDVYKGLAEDT